MHASDTESVELASYRLWDMAAVWYESWRRSRGQNAPPAVWFEFTRAFLAHYLPAEIRRARVDEFLLLRQNNMSIREYSLKFNSLARYAQAIVAEMEDRVHRFVTGLGPHLIKACMTASLQDGMDIARIQGYAQNLEELQRQAKQDPDRGRHKQARSAGYSGDYQGGYRPHYSKRPASSVVSVPSHFQGQRYDRSIYSRLGQRSRAPATSYRRETNQARPPLPRYDQCGKGHSG
ncbi:uncharacterized protein LOC132637409 [Lycium barbarum]|uniref:uncharacterized protein LOC132637409 n=1 Tax=Lycium barbarum TaxID=112863 RepID=UPI00293F2E94|nr:uncharacterized protein LOC132637409 [Lycium barbarum]